MGGQHRPSTPEQFARANERAYARSFDLWRRTLTIIESATEQPGRSRASPYERALEFFLLQAYKSLVSVGLLCRQGLSEDAAGSTRRLLEIALQVEHLARDESARLERAQRVFAYFWAYLHFAGLGDGPSVARHYEACKHLVELDRGGRPKNWWGGSIAALARDLNLMDTYREDYSWSSQASHATTAGVAPDTFAPGGFQVFTPEMTPALIAFATGYAVGSPLVRWNDQFSVVEPGRLASLADEIQAEKNRLRGPRPGAN